MQRLTETFISKLCIKYKKFFQPYAMWLLSEGGDYILEAWLLTGKIRYTLKALMYPVSIAAHNLHNQNL